MRERKNDIKYLLQLNEEQKQILNVRPVITDIYSITFRNENDLLSQSNNPEQYYKKEIMPQKISLSLNYIKTRTFFGDIKLIFKTIFG